MLKIIPTEYEKILANYIAKVGDESINLVDLLRLFALNEDQRTFYFRTLGPITVYNIHTNIKYKCTLFTDNEFEFYVSFGVTPDTVKYKITFMDKHNNIYHGKYTGSNPVLSIPQIFIGGRNFTPGFRDAKIEFKITRNYE